MAVRIYLIRHAEAEGNLWRRSHGWFDSDLTPNGEAQVSALEERMRGERVDAIYASDLTRTMKTAGAVSRACGVEITREPRLRELAMGEWEDAPWALLRRMQPDYIENFSQTADWHAPSAEDMDVLYRRTGEALGEILARHEGQSVCLVTHAVASRALLMRMYGGGLRDVARRFGGLSYLPNASVSLFEYEDGAFRELYFADAEHLRDLPTYAARRPAGFEGIKPELWFRPAQTPNDVGRAVEAWRESWVAVHGSEDDFSESSARHELFRIFEASARSIRFAMLGEDEAGVLIIDPMNRWEKDCGHILLLMLHERFRGYGLASQLIGEAAACCRALGRSFLRLRVAQCNTAAMALYRKNGFVASDYEGASDGGQFIMKRWIGAASERRMPSGTFCD